MKTTKYRLDEAEMSDLREAIMVASRHYANLAKEADVLGEPEYAEGLRAKSRHFLSLGNEAQHVVRVTVRLDTAPMAHPDWDAYA